MNVEWFRRQCLAMDAVTEEFPFGKETLVFKVQGKIFAIVPIDEHPGTCNLKSEPEKAEMLRERFSGVLPGYHMNKRHWNTVLWDGSVPDDLILQLLLDSYDLVVSKLPARKKRKG